MTLGKLLLIVAIAALVLTLLVQLVFKKVKNWPLSYLQNFAGVLFLVSGWVKAIDPLGTAYKMEQYFAEFEGTFADTWFSFLSPLFPWLSDNYAVHFSVFMIVLEIALGVMLVLGAYRKFTAWAFLVIVAFFTFLTGFTYLTGYVPEGVNFFQIAQWGPYVETNMKVTDCGCFGDFLKLEPRVSFLKDVFLMIPAIIFVLAWNKKHEVFSKGTRAAVVGLTIAGTFLYCVSNFVWDLPHTDFRPFKEGVDVLERKQQEEEAAANVQVLGYKVTNKETGETKELAFDQYMKEYKAYPKEEWDLEQIKSEPAIEASKISEFSLSSPDGDEGAEDILGDPDYNFFLVAYKLKGTTGQMEKTVYDTTYTVDTLMVGDSIQIQRTPQVSERVASVETYDWDPDYVNRWTEVVNPVMNAADEAGLAVRVATAYADPGRIDDFRHETQSAFPFYTGDDILLKTIIRSNPGVLLMKDGEIIAKWHFKKLPDFETIRLEYMK